MRYAIIDGNTVFTVADWDGGSSWSPPKGMFVVALNAEEPCAPGAIYTPESMPRFVLPPVIHVWTAFQFLNRFTDSELMDIQSRSVSDPIMWKFLTFATAAQEVISNDPVTVAGMDYLVLTGVLSQTRRNQILGE